MTCDSVRADHCSCYDYEWNTTPFLKKLAQKGLKFENAIVSGVPTSPSMFGMVSSNFCPLGREPITGLPAEIWRSVMRREKNIFEFLSNSGYQTGVFSHTPFFSSYYGTTRGCKFWYTNFLGKKDKGAWSRLKKSISILLRRMGIFTEIAFLKKIYEERCRC